MKTMTVKDLILAGCILGKFQPEEFMKLAEREKNLNIPQQDEQKTITFSKGYENVFFYMMRSILDNGLGKKYKNKAEFDANIENILIEYFKDIQMHELFRLQTNAKVLEANLIVEHSGDETMYEHLAVAGLKALISLDDIIKEEGTENISEESIREYEDKLNNRGGLQCIENMKWN